MPGKTFCSKCGGTLRSPNHVCAPTRISRHLAKEVPRKKRILGQD